MPSETTKPILAEAADPAGGIAATAENSLAEALALVRKRKWILLAGLVLGLIFGFYQSATQPIRYTASGRIAVRSGASNQFGAGLLGAGAGSDPLETEVLILQSDSLLETVAREMDLANNPDFGGHPNGPRRDLSDPLVRHAVVGQLAGSLSVSLIIRTNVITITCVASKPQLAADIVNHVINAYIQRSFETRFLSTQRVSQWLSGQLDDLKQQVETSQEQLIDLQKKLGVLGLGIDPTRPTMTESAASVDALAAAASQAKVSRILAESRYRVLSSADPNTLESTLDSTAIGNVAELNRLRTDIAETKATIAQRSVVEGPKNPDILALQAHLRETQRELDTEQSRLLTQSHEALVAAQANEKQTQEALDAQKNEAYKLRDQLVDYTIRQREYESNRALYDSLLSRLRAASVEAGLDSIEIDVVDQAQKPVAPTLRKRSTFLLESTALGLIAAFVVSFVLESLDTGVRSVAELESITGLPSLALIPQVRRSSEAGGNVSVAQANIGVLGSSNSQFAEAFRSLRTSLLLARTGNPPKVILVSSSAPGEGKTTVSLNLACVFAQKEPRVLLIDADLRRPTVHHRLGLNGRVGLSSVLAGAATLEEAIRQIPELPNLDILCSGPVPPFPTEMLSSDTMRELLRHCSEIYTHIVIDTPPVLSVTDAVVLSQQADATVLVVRHGKSSRHVVRRSRDLLVRSGTAMTGVILNGIDLRSPEYYGYYGYSGYGYSKVDNDSWADSQTESRTNRGETEER